MYRKSYAGFAAWLIVFLAAMLALCWFPADDPAVVTRLVMNLCSSGIAVLAWIIWRTGSVYWYTGVSFEDARNAGIQRRKAYAFRHFRLFRGCALITLAITLGAQMAGWPWHIDFWIVTAGLIAAALRTTAYRL